MGWNDGLGDLTTVCKTDGYKCAAYQPRFLISREILIIVIALLILIVGTICLFKLFRIENQCVYEMIPIVISIIGVRSAL